MGVLSPHIANMLHFRLSRYQSVNNAHGAWLKVQGSRLKLCALGLRLEAKER
jgi:hypothetical protein